MCGYCGCSQTEPTAHGHGHHDHEHGHDHDHGHEHETIRFEQSLLAKNDKLAERNRGFFLGRGIAAVNIVSSPGSGKTALLERTVSDIGGDTRVAVIVGDLATDNDAARLKKHGTPAVQITTGTVCHLDAHMVLHALEQLDTHGLQILFIENVGNLVCPSSFDLGEDRRVVMMSVTEGEDKPLKYPTMFHGADLVIVNKSDIAEAVEFHRDTALANIREMAPRADILEVSAKTGAGMDAWYAWLKKLSETKSAAAR